MPRRKRAAMPVADLLRVETIEGHGPYVNLNYWHWTDNDHNDSNGHPTPPQAFYDFKNKHPDVDVIFGFETEDQLNAWFTRDELNNLRGLDYHVRRVKGRIIGTDGYQCWFQRVLDDAV